MYVKTTNGTPERYTLRDLRKANPDTSFPSEPTVALLAEWGVYPYVKADPPTHDPATQVVEHTGYAEIGGAYGDTYVVRAKTQAELDADTAEQRAQMVCPKKRGILTLGETKWGEVLTYRDLATTTWAERMTIDSATEWRRTSQEVQFIGNLVGYTDEQMDALFIAAALAEA